MRPPRMVAAALAAFSLLLSIPASGQDLSGTTLRVGTWGGSWRDSLHELIGKKLEEQGVTVEYVIGNPQDNVAKLIAARGQEPPFDVFEGSPEFLRALIDQGMLQELNLENIPNAEPLPDFAKGQYLVMSTAAQDGIAYNTEKYEELGLPPPEHYSDLINEKLKGRVAFPDIGHVEHWNAVVGLAYDGGGTEADMEPALERVNEMDPSYFFVSSPDLATKFNSGDVWAAAWHAGYVLRLQRTGLPLAHAHPKIGEHRGALWPLYLHIPAGARNTAAAEAFINLYLSPEVQFEHSQFAGVLPMNPEARQRLAQDPENKDLLMLTDEELNQAFQIDWSKLDAQEWREKWNRNIAR